MPAATAATRRGLDGSLLAAPAPSVAPSAAFASVAGRAGIAATTTTTTTVRVVSLGRRSGWLSLTTGQVGASAVAHRDEQRGNVLAVLVRLLKGGAGAVRGNALTAEAYRHFIRLGSGAFDAPLRVRLVQADVVDDFALFVVEAAQKRASAEQAPETAVGESGESVCK